MDLDDPATPRGMNDDPATPRGMIDDPATPRGMIDDPVAADVPTVDVVGRIADDNYSHPKPQSADAMLLARVAGPASTDSAPPPEVPAGALKNHMLSRNMLTYVPRDWACLGEACVSLGARTRRALNAERCTTAKALVQALLQDDYALYEAPDGTRHMLTDAGVPDAAIQAGYMFEPSAAMLLGAAWVRDIRTGGVQGAKAKPGALERYDKEHPNRLPTCLLKKRAGPASGDGDGGSAKKRDRAAPRAKLVASDALPDDVHAPHGLAKMWNLSTFREALVANTKLVDTLLTTAPAAGPQQEDAAPAREDVAPAPDAPAAMQEADGVTVRVERWIDVALEILYARVVAGGRLEKAEERFAKDFPAAFDGFPSVRDAGADAAFKDEYLGLAWYVYTRYLQPAGVPAPAFCASDSRVAAALGVCSTIVASGKSTLPLDSRINTSLHPLLGRPASRDAIARRLQVYPDWATRAMPVAFLVYRHLLAPMGPGYASGAAFTFVPNA